jgi:predicted acetyltransferase
MADGAPQILPIGRDRAGEVLALDQWAFGFDADELTEREWALVTDELEWDRTWGAYLAGPERLSGVYSVVSADVPLPGGRSVRGSGLTWVGVHPRDRRRGVLTAMLHHHLADVAGRGEPISLLFAAEPTIYGRFGYGLASHRVCPVLARGAELRAVPAADELVVDLDHADPGRWTDRLAACYDRARLQRPGWLSRLDPRRRHAGAERLKVLTVADAGGELRGYALFRRRERWTADRPDSTVEVSEVVATDAAAARTLWGRLTDLDLTATVVAPPLAVDDPLLHLLVDARAAAPRWLDGLWVRVVDVPRALSARGYASEVDVVVEVTDPLMAANRGRWHLTGDRAGARCDPTDRPAQLSLDVRELGTVYLGGPTLAALATAGLVTATDGEVLDRTSAAFASGVAPHCCWQF